MRRRLSFFALAWGLLWAAGGPPARAESPLVAGRFDVAIETLARKLESSYVVHDTGVRYAALLRAELAHGTYAAAREPDVIAHELTLALQAVAPDGHLRVIPEAAAAHGGRREPPLDAVLPPGAPAAITDARTFEPKIAYLKLNEFRGDRASVATVEAFMREHTNATAIVFDARSNGGGGMEEMKVMLPYLFAEETSLVAMEIAANVVRSHGPPPDEGPCLRAVEAPTGVRRWEHFALPHPTERGLVATPVYYLISKRTASAAEHLALAFKRTKRAVLVGEGTAGGNHFGDFEPLGAGLSAFIPFGRTINPDTGEDWEGTGIEPDVAVPPAQALRESLRLARAALRR